MKKKYILIALTLVFITVLAVSVVASDNGIMEQAGEYFRDFLNSGVQPVNDGNTDIGIVATYHDQSITAATLEFHKHTRALLLDAPAEGYSDSQIIQMLLEDMMLVEEAESRGLAATNEEIEALVQEQRTNYEIPEVKAYLDEYCLGAEISIEDYFSYVEQIAPSYLSKQKLRNEIGRQYCEEHGLEFTNINPPQEMLDAIEAYIDELFEANKGDIVYYIDE